MDVRWGPMESETYFSWWSGTRKMAFELRDPVLKVDVRDS